MRNILTQQEINHIDMVCKEYGIENYTINPDGSIDVDSYVYLGNKGLDKLPIKFGRVSGKFNCNNNDLTSLEGCPESVGSDFDCMSSRLTSLEGCPSYVGGHFYCGYNKLTSLEFISSSIGGGFFCYNNAIPNHFMDLYSNLSNDEFKTFLKYQDDLRIWDNNGYNEEASQDLYEEIKDGML